MSRQAAVCGTEATGLQPPRSIPGKEENVSCSEDLADVFDSIEDSQVRSSASCAEQSSKTAHLRNKNVLQDFQQFLEEFATGGAAGDCSRVGELGHSILLTRVRRPPPDAHFRTHTRPRHNRTFSSHGCQGSRTVWPYPTLSRSHKLSCWLACRSAPSSEYAVLQLPQVHSLAGTNEVRCPASVTMSLRHPQCLSYNWCQLQCSCSTRHGSFPSLHGTERPLAQRLCPYNAYDRLPV